MRLLLYTLAEYAARVLYIKSLIQCEYIKLFRILSYLIK